MKLKLSASAATKLVLIVAIIVVAPYVAPFAIDFVILADLAGLEALILIVFAFSRSSFSMLFSRVLQLRRDLADTIWMLLRLPIFQPRIYFSHATLSSVLILACCSVVLAGVVWLPVLILSAQSIA